MVSPETIDLAPLLDPIPGPSPVGQDLRYAGAYDAIQEARRSDDGLAQGDWKRDVKVADWDGAIAIASDALRSRTKDLQIAAWLTEALVKRHAFAGLRDGLRLLRELLDRYWDSVYPAPDGDDLEPRASPFEWLNEKLPPTLRGVSLTRSRDRAEYSWLRWEESRMVDNLARQNSEAAAAAQGDGKISGEEFDRAVSGTPRQFYEDVHRDLAEAWVALEELDRALDERFGRQAPSLLSVKKTLEDCRAVLEPTLKRKRELEPDPPGIGTAPGAGGTTTSSSSPAEPGTMDAGRLSDRAAALRQLDAVAAFFRRTEPHSPVSYLVQRAVQWGAMPLEDWLREVIADDSVLAKVRETLGIREKEQGTSAGRNE